MSENSMMVLTPRKNNGIWIFDDVNVGLVAEPFVGNINVFIDELVKDIEGAENGFNLFFSSNPFPNYAVSLTRLREEHGGNWYSCDNINGMEGWLCPALFKYFHKAPEKIYASAVKMG